LNQQRFWKIEKNMYWTTEEWDYIKNAQANGRCLEKLAATIWTGANSLEALQH